VALWVYGRPMLRVVFDTTVFCNDFTLSNPEAKRVLDAAAAGDLTIHVSEVVIDETKRRYREDLTAAGQELASKAHPLQGGRFGAVLNADIRGDFQRAVAEFADRFDELLGGDGIVLEPYPDVAHKDVVERDLERRRPFRALNKGSTGYRDTLIWESFIEIVKRHPNDQVVFVTNNSEDYCDRQAKSGSQKDGRGANDASGAGSQDEHQEIYEFARKLSEELASKTGRTAPSVDVVRDLRDLANIYLPSAADEGATALTASHEQEPRVLLHQSPPVRAVLLEALFNTAPFIREQQFAAIWNPQDGGFDPPEVDLEIPEWLEDPDLDSIEGPSDVVINHVVETQTPGDWIVNTTHLAQLTFEAFALKADLITHDDPDVNVLEFDWNDHMSHVSTSRVVAVVTDVRCTFEGNDLTKAVPVQIETIKLISATGDY
jgi:hypothetical protein